MSLIQLNNITLFTIRNNPSWGTITGAHDESLQVKLSE